MEVHIQSKDKFIRDTLPFVNSWSDSFFISILEPEDEENIIPENSECITLRFYDIEQDIDNGNGMIYKTISEVQAKRLYEFIKSNSGKSRCFVHCHAGISRSSAVGSFVHEYFGGSYRDLLQRHPRILPNGHVTKLLRMYERIDSMKDDFPVTF